mmetsp:Transcript_138571/g.430967  ORF Transcript_138571/g.430967 Transcript_138571/m.430967 type:complete len:513 (+) Transcript_138571:79-1617(+)
MLQEANAANGLLTGQGQSGSASSTPWKIVAYVCYGLIGALGAGALASWAATSRRPASQASHGTAGVISPVATTTSTTTSVVYDQTRKISFITAETRGDPILVKVGDFEKRFETKVLNVGEGHKWDGYKSKVKILQKYLQGRLREGGGDDLVAFVDGSDVIWGGCDPGYFQHSYDEIVRLSGARIVFGAELACGEQDCNKVPRVPQWAEELSGKRRLNRGFWKRFIDGCRATWTDECSAKRDCGGMAACADPPSVRFLNSGFVMGPVTDLSKMFDWSLENYDNVTVWGDQSVFASYWLKNQKDITLDYTGAMVACISDMRWELLEAPLNCVMNRWVYLVSHREVQLQDHGGKVRFSPNKTRAEMWMLSDAGNGKYWITSNEGRQLVDSQRFVSTSIFKTEREMWQFSVGGGGVVYMTSPSNEQLQDDNGHPVFSENKQGWESWRIHMLDGTPACKEGRPVHGHIVNQAFDRTQCLIHGNGRGFWFLGHIVKSLTNKSVDEVRDWGDHKVLHYR